MADPGVGAMVGKVGVRVVPDTSKFGKELKAKLEKIEESVTFTVPVTLDTKGLKNEIDAVKKRIEKDDPIKLGTEVDGDGVVRETRRVRNLAQKVVGAIRLSVSVNVVASLARIRADLLVIQKAAQAYNIRIPVEWVGLTKMLAVLTVMSALSLGLGHAFGALGGLVNVLGGYLALLPSVVAGTTIGISTLIVGMKGVIGALKTSGNPEEFAEALKKLTPSARAAVIAMTGFKGPLSEIRKAVQESLFRKMAEPIKQLKVLLPPIKQGMVGTAEGIREMGRSWIKMATSQGSVRDMRTIMNNTAQGFKNATPAAADFAQALRDLTVVGSTFFPRMGRATADMAARFKNFIADARETGKLADYIDNAISKTKQFGRVLKNVWKSGEAIFGGFSNGREFLDMLEDGTKGMRKFLESAETQDTMKNLAIIMREIIDVAKKVGKELATSFNQVLKAASPFLREFARVLGVAIVGALKVVTPLLKDMFTWLSENKEVMVPLLVAVTGLVTGFKLLSSAAKGIEAIGKSFTAIKGLGGILKTLAVGTEGKGGIKGIINGLRGMLTTIGEVTAKVIWGTGKWIVEFAKTSASAIKHAALTASAWLKKMALLWVDGVKSLMGFSDKAVHSFDKTSKAADTHAKKTQRSWVGAAKGIGALGVVAIAASFVDWDKEWARFTSKDLPGFFKEIDEEISNLGQTTNQVLVEMGLLERSISNPTPFAKLGQNAKLGGNALDGLSTKMRGTGKTFTNSLGEMVKAQQSWTTSLFSGMTQSVTKVGNSVVAIGRSLGSGASAAKTHGQNTGANYAGGIKFRQWQAESNAQSMAANSANRLRNGNSMAFASGTSLSQAFAAGIASQKAYQYAWDAARRVTSWISAWLPASPAEVGPFSGKGWTPYRGQALVQGFADGMLSESKNLKSSTGSVLAVVADSFDQVSVTAADALGSAFSSGTPAAERWAKEIAATAPLAAQAVGAAISGHQMATEHTISGTVDTNVTSIAEAVKEAMHGVEIKADGKAIAQVVNTENVKKGRRN